jgi:hypothetical protein
MEEKRGADKIKVERPSGRNLKNKERLSKKNVRFKAREILTRRVLPKPAQKVIRTTPTLTLRLTK